MAQILRITGKLKGEYKLENLLSLSEAAKILTIKPKTLYNWVHQRKIPFIKVGRFVRFKEDDVNDFLKKNTVKAFEL